MLGSIALPGVEEGHAKLWPKTQKAFQYVWEHHRDDADWFFKADDDTYVLTDNLRSFLSLHDPTEPHYFGCTYDYGNNTIVNLGGAGSTSIFSGAAVLNSLTTIFSVGYVVSKEALRMFIEEALPNPEKCHTEIRPLYKGDEDTEFAMCLQSIGILPGKANDEQGRNLFFIDNPLNDISKVKDDYRKWQEVLSWRSEKAITFHYLKPEELYVFELLTNYFKHGDD